MRKVLWIIALVFAASLAPTVSRADTVYNVNVNIGGDIVTGTITTDGKLGQLTVGDITAYSLSDSLNNLGTTLTNANSFTASPATLVLDLVASATQLSVPSPPPFNTVFEVDSGVSLSELVLAPITNGSYILNAGGYFSEDAPLLSSVIGTAVPELNPTSGTSAIVLLACAVLIIRGRRPLPTTAS